MGEDKKTDSQENRSVVDVHTDKAIADIVRSLLIKPAITTGDLISDTIGILGDRVKRKRQLNAQLGLVAVRAKLEKENADIKDITPPDEEELHLLVDGLSLAGDTSLRDLWAGFFANALDPNSEVSADRPFISILQSLSATDARVLDFLAFVINLEKELNDYPVDELISEANRERLEIEQNDTLNYLNGEIRSKIDRSNLNIVNDQEWGENLTRLGLIEKPSHISSNLSMLGIRRFQRREVSEAFEDVGRELEKIVNHTRRMNEPLGPLYIEWGSRSFKVTVTFSSFGEKFAKSVGLLSDD